MASHYPLNGVDLDFKRYARQPFGGREVLVSRLMDDLMRPRRVPPKIYLDAIWLLHGVGPIKAEDRELGLDLQVLARLLEMECPRDFFITLEEKIVEFVQLHYWERDPLIHQMVTSHIIRDRNPKTAPGWKRDMIAHLALFGRARRADHRFSVFSGNSQLPLQGPANGKLSMGPCCPVTSWIKRGLLEWPDKLQTEAERQEYLAMLNIGILHKASPRSQSLPNGECWDVVASCSSYYYHRKCGCNIPIAVFPLKSLSALDKLSRRRSLSRTHIRAMFVDKPEWIVEDSAPINPRTPRPKRACANCAQYAHETAHCPSGCGYCNSDEHEAPDCIMKSTNRCKCRPFPQFHRASECRVQCSRRCGAPDPPGTYKHMNAILCSHRCCMCGTKGHSGKQCSLKRCLCGGEHLTQDCRWKVECVVKGCNFYLCHLHCRECGVKKGKGAENAFVGRTCQACLKNGVPVSAKAP